MSTDYAVRVVTTTPENPDHAAGLVDQLAPYGPAIGQDTNGHLDAQLTVTASSLDEAARVGVAAVTDALHAIGVPGSANAVEVMTDEAFEATLNAPPRKVDDLVSTAEAADILGTSRQRVLQLADSDPEFPQAVQVGRAWLRSRSAVARYGLKARPPGRKAEAAT